MSGRGTGGGSRAIFLALFSGPRWSWGTGAWRARETLRLGGSYFRFEGISKMSPRISHKRRLRRKPVVG